MLHLVVDRFQSLVLFLLERFLFLFTHGIDIWASLQKAKFTRSNVYKTKAYKKQSYFIMGLDYNSAKSIIINNLANCYKQNIRHK